jgi:hypothetical protein
MTNKIKFIITGQGNPEEKILDNIIRVPPRYIISISQDRDVERVRTMSGNILEVVPLAWTTKITFHLRVLPTLGYEIIKKIEINPRTLFEWNCKKFYILSSHFEENENDALINLNLECCSGDGTTF